MYHPRRKGHLVRAPVGSVTTQNAPRFLAAYGMTPNDVPRRRPTCPPPSYNSPTYAAHHEYTVNVPPAAPSPNRGTHRRDVTRREPPPHREPRGTVGPTRRAKTRGRPAKATTTKKHQSFVSEPMRDKPTTDIPGVGRAIGMNMGQNKVVHAKQVLGKYLCDGSVTAMIKGNGANARQARAAESAMKEYSDQFIN